uniref:Uncharacterized protein n=1 Tax=Brassica oleracea var. oleracea TaxID=109376 RepID=A0A0D3A3M3_BRAOL
AVDALYDCKSEVIGPGSFRFKAEIECAKQFRDAAKRGDDSGMLNVMSNYGMQCTKFYLRICHCFIDRVNDRV